MDVSIAKSAFLVRKLWDTDITQKKIGHGSRSMNKIDGIRKRKVKSTGANRGASMIRISSTRHLTKIVRT
jgi:hypothetical protein